MTLQDVKMQCFTATLQRTSAADGTEVYSLKCTAHRICSGRRLSFSHLLCYNVTQDGSLIESVCEDAVHGSTPDRKRAFSFYAP